MKRTDREAQEVGGWDIQFEGFLSLHGEEELPFGMSTEQEGLLGSFSASLI